MPDEVEDQFAGNTGEIRNKLKDKKEKEEQDFLPHYAPYPVCHPYI